MKSCIPAALRPFLGVLEHSLVGLSLRAETKRCQSETTQQDCITALIEVILDLYQQKPCQKMHTCHPSALLWSCGTLTSRTVPQDWNQKNRRLNRMYYCLNISHFRSILTTKIPKNTYLLPLRPPLGVWNIHYQDYPSGLKPKGIRVTQKTYKNCVTALIEVILDLAQQQPCQKMHTSRPSALLKSWGTLTTWTYFPQGWN